MNFDLAIIFPKLFLLLRRDILVTEEDYTSFGNQKTKFILLLVCKVFQLKSNDLRSDMRSQMDDFFCRTKQRFLFWVGSGTWINVLTIVVSDLVYIIEVEWFRRPVWITG